MSQKQKKRYLIRTTNVGSETEEKQTKQDKFDENIHRQTRNQAVATRKVAQESLCPFEEKQDGRS